MVLIIALNAALCFAVIAAVASPLLWAIFTQHRDHPLAVASTARVAEYASTQSERLESRGRRAQVAVA